jgi:2-iminobutanoate/2-iminopropanoate deaminase
MAGEPFDVKRVPLSMVRVVGDTIYVSGHVPIEDGRLLDAGIEEQTDLVLRNVASTLQSVGSSLDEVVKVGVFLTNAKRDFAAMNDVYARHFTSDPLPARTTCGVELAVDVLVEIEAIAQRGAAS